MRLIGLLEKPFTVFGKLAKVEAAGPVQTPDFS